MIFSKPTTSKAAEQDQIAADTEAFIAGGGEIKELTNEFSDYVPRFILERQKAGKKGQKAGAQSQRLFRKQSNDK